MSEKDVPEYYEELLNDAFWLAYICEVKKRLSNEYLKSCLSTFLLFFSSIFSEEVLIAKQGQISPKSDITKGEIKKQRMYFTKDIPHAQNKEIQSTIRDMGIDFQKYIFDIVLYVSKKELFDTNFSTWKYQDERQYDIANGAACTPYNWLKYDCPYLLSIVEKMADVCIKTRRYSKLDISPKSYSTCMLFEKSNLNSDDKVYLLSNYGILKSTLMVEKYFSLPVCMDSPTLQLNFDFNRFMLKMKAVLICKFGDDLSKSTNSLLCKAKKIYGDLIDDKFYRINRKCRNNIHYSQLDTITNDEITILNKYQNIYLKTILSAFNQHTYISFGFKYSLMKFLADSTKPNH